MQTKPTSEIIIYKAETGPELKITMRGESIWLSLQQIADLFERDKSVISRHIKNILNEAELSQKATVAKFATVQNEGKRTIERNIEYFNLDMVISVGYRVNSKRGTQFRIWATNHLRDYVLKGYIVNEQRLKQGHEQKLKELESTIKLFQTAIEAKRLDGYEKELLSIITDYTNTWILLNKYDQDNLTLDGVNKKVVYQLDYTKIKNSIEQFKSRLLKKQEASQIFGREVENKFQALLGNVEQTYDGKPLYPSIEEKAAHLFYFAIKDHPFADGNKRIGSLLLLLFLIENHHFYNKKGDRLISDNTLTALALLVAESNPTHKDTIIKLVVNLIKK